MASTFAGLSIASSGLNAAQIGLATTTNNMSNIDTTGYSRQVVSQTSIGPAAVYSSSLVGNGVTVTSVDRVRSFRLDQKYWAANSDSSKAEAVSTYLAQVETVFGSTDSSYISTDIDAFNTALSDMSTYPTDTSYRTAFLDAAETLCETLNTASDELTQLRSDLNSEVESTVAQINAYATQIAALNEQIAVATASGASTNELEDQRGVLVDELSGLVGITVTESDNGAYKITVEGVTLVNGDKAKELECYTVTDTTSDQYGMSGIRWAESDTAFDSGDSGTLNAYLEVRDGTTADSQGIPYYISQLDEFTRTFAEAFNEGVTVGTTEYSGHADGVGIDDDSTTDIRFFSYDDLSSEDLMASGADTEAVYDNITAANITISLDIQNDSLKIATASSTGGDSNTENLDDLISISSEIVISDNSTVSDLYNAIVAQVATDSASAETTATRTSARATYVNTSRTSVSGVSSDEETINLTIYESAYAASATMTSTWSSIYQTTLDMVDD